MQNWLDDLHDIEHVDDDWLDSTVDFDDDDEWMETLLTELDNM